MAAAPPETRDGLRAEFLLIQQETATGSNIKRARSRSNVWEIWCHFCEALNQDSMLDALDDPIPLLQLFQSRYHSGELAPQGNPVRARTAEEALRQVGRTFVELGKGDPRMNCHGKLDGRVSSHVKFWKNIEPPPKRVKPIPLSVLFQAQTIAHDDPDVESETTMRMIWMAYYFLCRPGEYTADIEGSHPFRLEDVQLFVGSRQLDIYNDPPHLLLAATFVTLTFTTQKNCVRGEVIGLGHSGHPQASPTRAIAAQVLYLRSQHAPPTTPLCSFKKGDVWFQVTAPQITALLRQAVTSIGHTVGITRMEISARSLRASGAMALLCAGVDPVRAQLVGRWRSDTMLRYLHVQAQPLVSDLAPKMLSGGNYSLLPQDILGAAGQLI